MYVVITRTTVPSEKMSWAIETARKSDPVFRKQPGLYGLKTYVGEDGQSLSSVFEWRSKADHEACMQSPDFAQLGAEWGEMFASDAAKFEVWTGGPS
jgi:heme-degrading monooxygenase HmoA